jgi:hypothetical protein
LFRLTVERNVLTVIALVATADVHQDGPLQHGGLALFCLMQYRPVLRYLAIFRCCFKIPSPGRFEQLEQNARTAKRQKKQQPYIVL